MKSWITQLRKGLLEYCVLSVLRHKEGYGYEVVTRLKTIDELIVTESTVYPILSRLKRDGYLLVRTEPSPSGPPRRYFSLTSLGKQHLQSMDCYWDDLNHSISQLRNTPIK
ncbi:MAG: PadR family transcriptional regulator PadR [Rubritalea sp.]|jgi:PadR family transcriptional regulator PadR